MVSVVARLIVRRLIQAVFVVWSVGTITFFLSRALPGDMAWRIAAGRYGYDNVSAAAAASVREQLGLERPAWQQYLHWLGDLVRLDLGESLVSGETVSAELQHQLGASLLLAGVAMGLTMLIAWSVGVLAAMRPSGWVDQASLFASAVLRAQPVFVVGLCLILVFALRLRWLPVAGWGDPAHVVLPAASLALVLAAAANRVVYQSARDALTSDWFSFARLKGLTFAQAFRRHAIRNFSVPVVAFFGIQLVTLIEGIVMIESLFSWPGIGHALTHAVFGRDIPMI